MHFRCNPAVALCVCILLNTNYVSAGHQSELRSLFKNEVRANARDLQNPGTVLTVAPTFSPTWAPTVAPTFAPTIAPTDVVTSTSSSSSTSPFICSCENGVGAAALPTSSSPRGNVNCNDCASCDSGYTLHKDPALNESTCDADVVTSTSSSSSTSPYICSCEHGVGAAAVPSSSNPRGNANCNDCASCDSGYSLHNDPALNESTCEADVVTSTSSSSSTSPYICSCENGVGAAALPSSSNPRGNPNCNDCASCDSGYSLHEDPALNESTCDADVVTTTSSSSSSSTSPYICACENGVGADAVPSSSNPRGNPNCNDCASCDSGYALHLDPALNESTCDADVVTSTSSSSSTAPYICSCENGVGAAASPSSSNPRGNPNCNDCASCDSGYSLNYDPALNESTCD